MSKRYKHALSREMSLADVLLAYASHPEFENYSLLDANSRGADNSVLNVAAFRGEISHVKVLVANKANVNFEGDMGYTPLHDAVSANHLEVAEYLLQLGANAAIPNEFGDTALDMASKSGNQEMAKLIRRHLRK